MTGKIRFQKMFDAASVYSDNFTIEADTSYLSKSSDFP